MTTKTLLDKDWTNWVIENKDELKEENDILIKQNKINQENYIDIKKEAMNVKINPLS